MKDLAKNGNAARHKLFVITSDWSDVDFGQIMRQKYVVGNILEELYAEDAQLTSVGCEEKVM